MKLSVMTYRASCERLNILRQSSYSGTPPNQLVNPNNRRGSSLDSCLLGYQQQQESHSRHTSLRNARMVSFDLSDKSELSESDNDDDDVFGSETEASSRGSGRGEPPWQRGSKRSNADTQSCSSQVSFHSTSGQRPGDMMVDGSPGRIAAPQSGHNSNSHNPSNNSTITSTQKSPTSWDSGTASSTVANNSLGTVLLIPGVGNSPSDVKPGNKSSSSNAAPSEASNTARSSRSRWLKLRTTVQLSGAITQVHKKPPLKREDSFLKRFSTRHIADPCSVDGSTRQGDSSKGTFLGSWRSVVNPDENILFWWLSLLTACLLYNAWTIIARQAFPELQRSISPTWYAADGFSDVVFILDIAFQFRTGYLEQGLMVYESKKLAGHYFKSRSFLMDIAAVTPLDLVQLWIGIFPIIRFPRFLKVYRSFRFYYMVESRTIYPNLWRVVNLIHILLLLAHWFGCFYYMLSELEGFDGQWSYPKPVGDYATLPRKYLGSVYWSTLTLTTIGDLATPATNLQYLFTIISYLIGVFIFATIVGQVGNVITNRNASRLEFERLLDGAKLYMRHHKVPRNMQRRVQRWYDYSWSRGRMQGGGDINSALGILPDKLKTELALHVNLKTLKKVSIFQECQPEFLHDLVLKMKAYIFTPGDLICRKGEVAREMFIIADGVLEVISETGKVLTQMKAGDFFGEIGILNLDGFNRRTADVRSVGYSELFSLSREDILTAMKDYPEAQEILQTMGRKRLMEARLAANMNKNPKDDIQGLASKRGGGGGGIGIATEQGKRGGTSQKPKTAVSKLKEDVRSLKKLLRSRSTPTGKACLQTPDEQSMELKTMPCSPNRDPNLSDGSKSPTGRRRKASLQALMKKIHFKGDSQSSSGSKDRTRSKLKDTGQSGSITSRTDSTVSIPTSTESTDSASHLNKALPLLQRIRLLGEQEKTAARPATAVRKSQPSANSVKQVPPEHPESGTTHEVIGEGLPLLERLKLLRQKEAAQATSSKAAAPTPSKGSGPTTLFKARTSVGLQKEVPKPQHPPAFSPTKKASSLTTRLASAIGTRTTSQTTPAVPQEPRHPIPLSSLRGDNRTPEFPSELPLLKKVLLMKMMEDNKLTTTQGESKEGEPKRSSEPSKSSIAGKLPNIQQAVVEVGSDKMSEAPTKSGTADKKSVGKLEPAHYRNISPVVAPSKPNVPVSTSATDSLNNKESPPAFKGSKVKMEESDKLRDDKAQKPTPDDSESVPSTTARIRKDSTTAALMRSNTSDGYNARKAQLSRMMALREDSDEHGSYSSSDDDLDISSDDPFVKNIECLTEVHRSTSTSPDTWSPKQPSRKVRPDEVPEAAAAVPNSKRIRSTSQMDVNRKRKKANDALPPSDDGIHDYLIKVMKNVKHIVKSYVLEQQQELHNRVVVLEKEVREKDVLIQRLKANIYTQNTITTGTFDEVSSLDGSSFSSSDSEEVRSSRKNERIRKRNLTPKNLDSERPSQEADDEDDVLNPEEEAILESRRPTSQRKSWTYGGNGELSRTRLRRKMLLHSKQSYSLDDEKCQVSVTSRKPNELWKLEFPIPENSSFSSSYEEGRSTVQHVSINESPELIESVPEEIKENIPEVVEEEEELQEEEVHQEQDEFDINDEIADTGSNDWELQMLVQQFEKNVRQKRRHSSGEVLSWQAVLGNRLAANAATSSDTVTDQQKQIAPPPQQQPKRSNRKFSLVDDRLPHNWDASQQSNVQHGSMWQLSGTQPQNSNFTTCLQTKLSPGEINGTTSSSQSQNPSKLDKKTVTRRRAFRHRRQNSFNEFKPQPPPTQLQQRRKCSLPSVDALHDVSISKWTSMEHTNLVRSTSPNARDKSVVAVDPETQVDNRFGSLEDVSSALQHRRHPWPRSPSSPNFPTHHQFWESGAGMSEHCIPEWPSSPCLPTITEDDHSVCPSLTSSPCRSFSHDCLPSLPPSPLWQTSSSNSPTSASFWTTRSDSPQLSPDALHLKLDNNLKRSAKELQSSSELRSPPMSTKVSLKDMKEDSRLIPFAQTREDSVVIAIPECEPLLSPR